MEVNSIYEGDNLEILSKFPSESVDLIYLDPPFFSNRHYEVIWKDGAELRAFQDRWQGGIEHYISWMEPRLRECHRVLKDTGSIYLHCDWHANARLRILLDKIFGENNFRNEIIWCYSGIKRPTANKFPQKNDYILSYHKGKKYIWNVQYIPHKPEYLKRWKKDSSGRLYRDDVNKTTGGMRKIFLDELPGDIVDAVWTDIPAVNPNGKERQGYPTQKPIALLERIIKASSNSEDIVLDPFCGCGTTLVAAQKLKRKWVGIDISPTACKLMVKRLRSEFSINPHLIKGTVDLAYVRKLQPFEFQNWVVVDKFLGTVTKTKSGDMGIDGLTPQVLGGYPIQVKQSEDVGRNVIDNFQTAMRRLGKKKGYIVAFSFGKGSYEEVARAKNQEGLTVILRTVQELIDGKVEE